MSERFDAEAKERALRAESEAWDLSRIAPAQPGDIPVLDLTSYLHEPNEANLTQVATLLSGASRGIGFYRLTGHGIETEISRAFVQAQRYFALPDAVKRQAEFGTRGAPIPGTGYLPLKHQMLPRRSTGNENEALIVKSADDIDLASNPWPDPQRLPEFKQVWMALARSFARLAAALLPIYARALELPADYFSASFVDPFYRLRMTRYPAETAKAVDRFGIAPHVDTTFFTLLAQQSAGLYVHDAARDRWLSVPFEADSLVVNNGEILKVWSNDEFVSTRHFANNPGPDARYVIPFFYNPNQHAELVCLPSCRGPGRPAKYPPFSYATSQATVQGE